MGRFLAACFVLMLTACQTVPARGGFAASQIAVLRENGFAQVGNTWELGLENRLLFPLNDSNLAEGQVDMLARLARALADVGIVGARVEGHTDSTGSAGHNQTLSLRRAQSVSTGLAQGGMNRQALHPVGRGEARPIESNRTADGRRENRRVVIVVSPGG